MPRVRNKATGRAWDVPAGHQSLTSVDYEVLPDRPPEPEPVKAPAAPPAPKAPPKPRARKTK